MQFVAYQTAEWSRLNLMNISHEDQIEVDWFHRKKIHHLQQHLTLALAYILIVQTAWCNCYCDNFSREKTR
jgi:hypothetical protein